MTPSESGGVPSIDHIRANAEIVRDRIGAAGGDVEAVTLVAVTKGFGPAVALAACGAGLRDLGENYAQELLAKIDAVESGPAPHPTWHFLGRLQSNKVRSIATRVGLWQSIDRIELIREVAVRAPGAAILVQINLSGEPQKGGCAFGDAEGLVDAGRLAGLDVRGLMGVASAGDPDRAAPEFERLVALADRLALPVRSIGMSSDLEVAVRAGATMVRVGRDLFGERPPR